MTTVSELQPGDLVRLPTPAHIGPSEATFIASTVHPIWAHLQLVVWRMPEGSPIEWSHDALDARQDVGDAIPATPDERSDRLRAALTGGSR